MAKIVDQNIRPLTRREMEIQILLTQGMRNKMIARELNICEGTVKIHIKNLMSKLHVRSRLEIALIAMRDSEK